MILILTKILWIEHKGMTFDRDYGYSFPLFSSSSKKRGKSKGEWIAKIEFKSHAFLLDQYCGASMVKYPKKFYMKNIIWADSS